MADCIHARFNAEFYGGGSDNESQGHFVGRKGSVNTAAMASGMNNMISGGGFVGNPMMQMQMQM